MVTVEDRLTRWCSYCDTPAKPTLAVGDAADVYCLDCLRKGVRLLEAAAELSKGIDCMASGETPPFKAGDLVIDTRCAELRTVDRVFRHKDEWMLDMTTMDRIPIKHIRSSWVKHA